MELTRSSLIRPSEIATLVRDNYLIKLGRIELILRDMRADALKAEKAAKKEKLEKNKPKTKTLQ